MTTPTPTPETFIPAIGREALFQPWHGGPCPLCPQGIVTVKTQSGEEHTGLAKNFQWEWKHGRVVARYPEPPCSERAEQKNVIGFYPLGSCQRLTGAACSAVQNSVSVKVNWPSTLFEKICVGLLFGLALYKLLPPSIFATLRSLLP